MRGALVIWTFHITGINPEPWTAPEHGVGRRNGKIYVEVYKSAGLAGYQEGIKEEIKLQNGHLPDVPLDENLQVTFWLDRALDQSETDRKTNRNVADATNMQKALEDALQGLIYVNDRRNLDVRTIIERQSAATEPHITIEIRSGDDRTTPPSPPRPEYGNPYPVKFAQPEEDLF